MDTPEFEPLLNAISATAVSIISKFGEPIENDIEEGFGEIAPSSKAGSRRDFVSAIRLAIRERLNTQPVLAPGEPAVHIPELMPLLEPTFNAVHNVGELFVGMANGPHMLVLKAGDPDNFLEHVRNFPSQNVRITWSHELDSGRTWIITPREGRPAYKLFFRLPQPIGDWIFSRANVRRAAVTAKEKYFSSITIYRTENGQDSLIRLRFDPDTIGG
jgi:hypothetical protein